MSLHTNEGNLNTILIYGESTINASEALEKIGFYPTVKHL